MSSRRSDAKLDLTPHQSRQYDILDPILQSTDIQDDGTLTKLMVSFLGPTPESDYNTLKGHESNVISSCVALNDMIVVSASLDNTLKSWEISTGDCLRTFYHHDSVTSCCVSTDSRLIVAGTSEGIVKCWSMISGQCLWTSGAFDGHDKGRPVLSCCIASNNQFMISTSHDRNIHIWHMTYLKFKDSEGKRTIPYVDCYCRKTIRAHAYSSCISTDNRWIISAGWDKTVNIWDVETGECLQNFIGHTDNLYTCCISADNKMIVSGGADYTLKIWSTETGKCIRTLDGHTEIVTGCCLSSSKHFIVSASLDHTLKIWNTVTGDCTHTLQGHTDRVSSCCLSSDDRLIISTSCDRTVKIWDTLTGELYAAEDFQE